jgi:Ni2+-binding GTPase involved in maturation of urease and hydrogenase
VYRRGIEQVAVARSRKRKELRSALNEENQEIVQEMEALLERVDLLFSESSGNYIRGSHLGSSLCLVPLIEGFPLTTDR